MFETWKCTPIAYGQPGWAEQFRSNPTDGSNKYQPSAEYTWRSARRRPEFQAFVEWAYAHPELGAELDYYDWSNDESYEAMTVSDDENLAEMLQQEAKSRGLSLEWGDTHDDGTAKVWLVDPAVDATIRDLLEYNTYTLRSQQTAACEGGQG